MINKISQEIIEEIIKKHLFEYDSNRYDLTNENVEDIASDIIIHYEKIIHEIDLDHTAKLSAFATAIEEHHENELNKYRDELVEEENGH